MRGVWIQIIERRPELRSGEELGSTKSPRRQEKKSMIRQAGRLYTMSSCMYDL